MFKNRATIVTGAVILSLVLVGISSYPVRASVTNLFNNTVDSHLVEAMDQLRAISSDGNTAERVMDRIERAQTLLKRYRNAPSSSRLKQLYQAMRDSREHLGEWHEELREDVDEQVVELFEEGVDWEDFRERQSKNASVLVPATPVSSPLLKKVVAVDHLLRRSQRYLTMGIQVRLTGEVKRYQYEYLRQALDLSFRNYLADHKDHTAIQKLSGHTYRRFIRGIARYVRAQSDTTYVPTPGDLGRRLQRQGRVLLELPPGHGSRERVLNQLSNTVRQLLPGTDRDRYDALRR